MKKIFALAMTVCAFLTAESATSYVFTMDGKTAALSASSLPSQGRNFTTGETVTNLQSKTGADLASCGWYAVQMPHVELGTLQYVSITGYVFTASNGVAHAQVVVKDGAPVKKYTQYKIIGLLMKMGKWAQVKEYLIANDLYDLFMGAQFLSNADANFVGAKKQLSQLLGIEEMVIDELLETCVDTE